MDILFEDKRVRLETVRAFLVARSRLLEGKDPDPADLDINENTEALARQSISVAWDTANRVVSSGLFRNVDGLIRCVLSNSTRRSERFAFIQAGRLMEVQRQGVIDATTFTNLQSRIGICNMFAALLVISGLPPQTEVDIPELR